MIVMRILIIGINYFPEQVGIGPYTAGMVESLVASGHQVHVIAGKPYYPAWKTFESFKGWGWHRSREGGVSVVRCPHYVPADPTGARRILHHVSFALSAFVPTISAAIRFRPDLVLAVAPSLLSAPIAQLAAKLCRATTWLHIQDFEIEAAFATGLIDDQSMAASLALGFQSWILKRFDRLSSISPQMCEKLKYLSASSDKVVEFRNWSDTKLIHPLSGPSGYRAEWKLETPNVALYSGNIANKQGIGIIIEAARILQDRKDITFVICGDGPNKAQLIASSEDLSNIRFLPLQPIERLNDLLGVATMHLLPQLAEAADLVLPSKLTNMLASGKPIVATALRDTGLATEVDGCGLISKPGSAEDFAAAIATLADDPVSASELGTAARNRAIDRWSKEMILARFNTNLMSTSGLAKS
jgi:colanic acid biosynthesis glycosyl transferase WcaI